MLPQNVHVQRLILGAASNVIMIQDAQNRFGKTITFQSFAKVGNRENLV
jgi:Na+/H+ antiporter NhaD/arsenite permease-like protein